MNWLEHYRKYQDSFIINKHPDKELYVISYKNQSTDWTIPGARSARGLVLNGAGNIVSIGYDKFFNYNQFQNGFFDNRTEEDSETYDVYLKSIPDEIKRLSCWDDGEFSVYDKLDGSLILMFMVNGELYFNTTSTFTSDQAELARLVYSKLKSSQRKELEKICGLNNTLIFELIGPSNPHVVSYKKDELVLHGVRSAITKYLWKPDAVEKLASLAGIRSPEKINMTNKDEIVSYIKNLKGAEGVVIRFDTGKFLKIKSEEYLEMHYLKSDYVTATKYTKKFIYKTIEMYEANTIDDILAACSGTKSYEMATNIIHETERMLNDFKEYENKFNSGEFVPKEIAKLENSGYIFLGRNSMYKRYNYIKHRLRSELCQK